MNLLTDDEIDAITDQQWDGIRGREIAAAHRAYARAIEAAVLSKLTAGYVVPEPVHHIMSDGVSIGYYSLDQLQAYAAGRAAGLSAEPVGYTYTIRDVAHGAIDDQTLKAGTPLYTKEEL